MEKTSLLSGSVWLSLPQETRAKIAELFEIKKSGSVYVVNGPEGPKVQSDGYSYDDLSVITVERMQEITGSKSDNFYHLFKNIVAIVEDEALLEEAIEEKIEVEIEKAIIAEVTAEEFDKMLAQKEKELTKKKFCEKCDSKGTFHKKGCPNKVPHAKKH